MSEIYTRYYTLKKFIEKGSMIWRFVQTNDWGPNGKSHLLQMRKEGLVQTVNPYKIKQGTRIPRNPQIGGPDLNANFYGLTYKGIQLLKEKFPDIVNDIDASLNFILKQVLDGNMKWYEEMKKRM